MLLVEQNATVALAVAHHGYIMENGKIVIDGSAERLASDPDVREFYLGVGGSGEARSFRAIKHYKRRKRWLSMTLPRPHAAADAARTGAAHARQGRDPPEGLRHLEAAELAGLRRARHARRARPARDRARGRRPCRRAVREPHRMGAGADGHRPGRRRDGRRVPDQPGERGRLRGRPCGHRSHRLRGPGADRQGASSRSTGCRACAASW